MLEGPYRLRRSAIKETLLYLGVAMLLDRFVFRGDRFWSISPHPFWPIILLTSAQYGTSEGLFAALAATIALLTGNLPKQTLSQDLYDYIFYIAKNPLLWFTATVVVGELRGRHAVETKGIREELETTKTRLLDLGTAYKQMAQLNEKLELRVAGQLKTAIRIYEAARCIEKLEPAHVLTGVSQLIRVVMSPEKFSLFLFKNGRLELASKEGWTAEDRYELEFNAKSSMYQEVIGRQRCLCCAHRDEQLTLAGEGMLAGPLVNSETGEILGMVKIEKLGFLELNLSNIQTFKVLCEWIATAYANALRYKDALSEKIYDESTSLFSQGFFDRQTTFLSSLAARVGFDVSMVSLRLDNPDDLTDEQRSLLPGHVGRVVQESLRRTDLAFEYSRQTAQHNLVLPNTSLENSQIVCDKLISQLGASLPPELRHAQFSTTVQAIYRCEGQQRKQELPFPEHRGSLPESLFNWHCEYLRLLGKRIGFRSSVVSLGVRNISDWKLVVKALRVGARLRPEDLVFEPFEADGRFRILLPKTTLEEARIVAGWSVDKINEELGRNSIEAIISADVEELIPDTAEMPSYV